MNDRVARIVVLASGNGSNLQAVIDSTAGPTLTATVVAVFSDRAGAFALDRARRGGIPAIAMVFDKRVSRTDYDASLADAVAAYEPDFILLLGWMRLLSDAFLSRFPGKVVNLHPALPGTFPGTHAIERAFQAFRSGAITKTGVMVHYVPDEGIDSGPTIAIEEIEIRPDDDIAALEARVHETEHRLIVKSVFRLVQEYKRRG